MHQKIFKIVIFGCIGLFVPLVLLATITKFVIAPSLAFCFLFTLAAVASYVPPQGVPIVWSILSMVSAFSIALMAFSRAFRAVAQPSNASVPAVVVTIATFAVLLLIGYRKRPESAAPSDGGTPPIA